ncbi:MAG: sigma-70 family RNA polymerase sigma factor [Campylobacterota bacterium]|nr:sigma-70 family RNA polymerase sigma factor [Campylobacterota bacterium]
MELILTGVVVLAIVVIFYLLKQQRELKKEIALLQEITEVREKTIENLQIREKDTEPIVDLLTTHDKVIEMFESGESIESISEQLKIPQSKVEMTLKFEKMKKDGPQ